MNLKSDWKNAEWSKYLYDNIPASMLKAKLSDGDLYYKGYNELSDAHKREFFVMLFSSLARFESGFKPETTYREDFADSNGDSVISTGLFQVSVESLGGYGFKTTKEKLKDPYTNIDAMLVVANRWLVRDGCIAGGGKGAWRGMARYWSVFRKHDRIEVIRENTNALTFNKGVITMNALDEFYRVAKSQMGIQELSGKQHNKKIVEYHACTSLRATDDETPWCASFVNWVMKQVGVNGTNSAAARSFSKWGNELKTPVKGCVVVFTRKGGGHVAFYHSEDNNFIYCLGGNQSNSVNISAYRKDRLLGYRGI